MPARSKRASKRTSARRSGVSARGKNAKTKKGARTGKKIVASRSTTTSKKASGSKSKRGRIAVKPRKAAKKSTRATGKRAGTKATSTSSRRAPAKPRASRRPSVAASLAGTVSGGLTKNPLTHRGTKPSRTQTLFEHQGAPVEPATHPENAGTDASHGSNLGELVRNTEVRNQTLLSRADQSRGKVVENHLAATANARIRGHASGAGRRAQGRRDAAQRGEKRPDKGGFDS